MTKPLVKGLFYILCLIFGHGSNTANAQVSDMQSYNNNNEGEEFKVAGCSFDNTSNNQYINNLKNVMSSYY